MTARPRGLPFAVGAVVAFGAALRLIEYGNNRPLWIDEAMVAFNVARRSPWGLLRPLDFDQSASPLFLTVTWVFGHLGGMTEMALRFAPLIAGLCLPLLTWYAGRRLVGEVAAAVATVLVAVSVPLIRYSAEVKQYGIGALVAVLLLWLMQRVREAPADGRRWAWLNAAGAIGLGLSIPAVFTLAGVGAALLVDPVVRRTPRAAWRMAILAAVWATVGAVLFTVVYRAHAENAFLRVYWEGTFLDPRAPNLPARLYRLVRSLSEPFPAPLDVLRIRWLGLIVAAGVAHLAWRRAWPALAVVGGALAAGIAASALGAYPVATRLWLFWFPSSALLVGTVAEFGIGRLIRSTDAAIPFAILLTLLWSAPGVLNNARHPYWPEEGRDAARFIQADRNRDPVYVLPPGLPGWSYYAADHARGESPALDRIARFGAGDGPSATDALLPVAEDVPDSMLTTMMTGRRVLLGRRSGLRHLEPEGLVRDVPDADWAGREVDRMAMSAAPYIWVYGTHLLGPEWAALRAAIWRRGFVPVTSMDEVSAVALRLRRPSRLPARTAPP